tara:strand:+ start:750 stop:1706 length:957 start_codon:yes stop_codon:yes gene_type:complete
MWSMNTIEWLDIELTSFCNIECKGCFRIISKHADKILNKEYITIDTIRERFDKNLFPKVNIINFCGSVDEPTSHPQFFDIIRHFADWNAHINIATNGSLRTVKWWTELAGILPKTHTVTWGIDGSDELSEVYRQGSSFKKVEQNYRAFNSAGGRSNWQFIVFEHNEHQLEEAKQKASDEGFKSFKTIISHRKDTKGNIKAAKTESIDNAKEIPYISCKYGNQKRIFINHMGNVIPCCHLNSKMLEYSVTGTVKDKFEQLLVDNDYRNTINLRNTTMQDAINSSVWKGIINSWDSDDPMPRCMQVCKQMKRDKFIQEEL